MKKKLIIFITFLLLSNFCFAGIVVQSGLSPLGYDIRYEEDCFNVTNPKDFSTEFLAAIHSLNSSLMWEFNSNDIEKPFHFMTGAEFSFSTPGLITITIPTIFEFTLLNMTTYPADISIDLYFENAANEVRYIKYQLSKNALKRLNIVGEEVDGDAVYFNWLSLKGQGIPENARFSVRFMSDKPIVVSHEKHKAAYVSPVV